MHNKNLAYRPDIDGLRAIAVLGVLLFHLNADLLPGGFTGVDIFFVISGYLITGIIIREMAAGKFSFKRFYERRVRRIFPALFAMLFIVTPIAYVSLYQEAFINFVWDLKYAAAQISNFHFAKEVDYFHISNEKSALLHTWSLGVEEQFYLLWPLLLLFLYKWKQQARLLWVFLAIGVSSVIIGEYFLNASAEDSNLAFYMLWSRAFQLIIGGIVALPIIQSLTPPKRSRHLAATLGIVLIAYSYFNITSATPYPGLNGLIPAFGAALVIFAHIRNQPTIFYTLLSWRPLVYVGLISYSLYLWHWPLIALTETYTQSHLTPFMMVIVALFSFLLAMLSYHFIETPFRKQSAENRVFGLRAISSGLAIAFIFIIAALLAKPVLEEKLGKNEKGRFTLHEADEVTGANRIYGTFEINDQNGSILLTGDSHAGHYLEGLIDWGWREKKKNIEFISRAACQTFGTLEEQLRDKQKCEKIINGVNERVKDSARIDYIFIAQRYDNLILDISSGNMRSDVTQRYFDQNAPILMNALRNSVKLYKDHHPEVKIVLLGQVPKLLSSPQHCIQRNDVWLNRFFPQYAHCDPSLLDKGINDVVVEPMNTLLKNFAESEENVIYFDPRKAFPYDKSADWYTYYRDSNHIKLSGSKYVSEFFDF